MILRGVMSYTSKVFWLLAVPVLLVALDGCGFHLRGSGALRPELQQVFIDPEYLQTGFGRKLQQSLRARGITVVDHRESAQSILQLTQPANSRRLLSVNELAQARDYLLASKVRLSLLTPDGEPLLPEQTVEVRRELVADPNNVLGTDQEAQRLFLEMQQELVQAVLRRLRRR